MAQKAMEHGLVCFNMRISPKQIQKETSINIQICFKCYEMESHTTTNCPKKEKRKTEAGAIAPQRPRDPRKPKEQIATDRPPIIDGQALNLRIYIPEKYHHTGNLKYLCSLSSLTPSFNL